MKQTCKDLADDVESEPEPFALATRAIRRLCISIGDGNGRVARILINVVLLKYAERISVIGTDKGDAKEYLDIVAAGCAFSQKEDFEDRREDQESHLKQAEFVNNYS